MRCNIIDIVQRVCVIHYFLYAFKRIYYQQLGYYLYFCGMNIEFTLSRNVTIKLGSCFVLGLLSACSAEKFIPENNYMLTRVEVKSQDKKLNVTSLEPYLKQKANSKWFSLFKVPMGTYTMAGTDSTKWINRFLKGIGEKPIVYDSLLTKETKENLRKALWDMGYLNAQVDTISDIKKKKIKLTYLLKPSEQFKIRHVFYDIKDDSIASLLQIDDEKNRGLRTGMPFSVEVLNNERKRITSVLSNLGYYKFHRDFMLYRVDSVAGEKKVDVELDLLKYKENSQSPDTLHPRYKIRDVIYSNIGGDTLRLSKRTLKYNTLIDKGDYYNSSDILKTYNKLSKIQIINYSNIRFAEVPDTNLLDCYIQLKGNKTHLLSLQPEGTNTSGDLGAALTFIYENRNVFHGGEVFSVKLRGAYEAITRLEGYKDKNYQEYNVETKLVFQRFLAPFLSHSFKKHNNALSELSVRYDLQNRPEFHRRVFSTAWRYRWSEPKHNLAYRFDLLDVDYVYMPWISETFKRDYLDNAYSRNAILRYNYQDLFIVKMGFGLTYNDGTNALRVNFESSGNLLNAFSRASKATKTSEGRYTLFNIAYAQYVKGDIDYSKLVKLDERNALAFHVGLGVAYPYGNSKILPFEKRYFSGGANSVRGWNVRSLGPGTFAGVDLRIDFINKTGDLRLDLNAEYRTFLFWKLNGALFVDAGNIWTLRNYSDQPGGMFKLNEFYKQIAVAYGLGLRFNFDYFILRFDLGIKAVNPVYTNGKEHYPIWHPNFKRDATLHFAVGLPF